MSILDSRRVLGTNASGTDQDVINIGATEANRPGIWVTMKTAVALGLIARDPVTGEYTALPTAQPFTRLP